MSQKKLKIAILTAFLALGSKAAAEEEISHANSEALHQPEAGQIEVAPATGLGLIEYKAKDESIVKTSAVIVPFAVDLDYGVSSMFSAGLGLTYFSGTILRSCSYPYSCPDSSIRGLLDPKANVKLRFALGPGTLRTGARLSIALEHSKKAANGDVNLASGGTTLQPFLAYEIAFGRGVIGGVASYDLYKSGRRFDDSSSGSAVPATLKGGQVFGVAGFYEFNLHKLTFGGLIEYDSTAHLQTETSSGETTSAAFSTWSAEFYLPIHFTPRITLIPTARYDTQIEAPTSNLDSINTFSVTATGRFEF